LRTYRKNQNQKRALSFTHFTSVFTYGDGGPIERHCGIVASFVTLNVQRGAKAGVYYALRGTFHEKVVIADRLAMVVVTAITAREPQRTDVARQLFLLRFKSVRLRWLFEHCRGCARIMGFLLMEASTPRISLSPVPGFGISLSTWFKDYLYIPLGGNRVSEWRCILITSSVSQSAVCGTGSPGLT
jgi:D-alanyl-lipoteichoic acid acyltransferase DltB (MBOAT superfamily)